MLRHFPIPFLHPGGSTLNERYRVSFARALIVVLWDGGTMHKGVPTRTLLARHAERLTLERLPRLCAHAQPGRAALELAQSTASFVTLLRRMPANSTRALRGNYASSREISDACKTYSMPRNYRCRVHYLPETL